MADVLKSWNGSAWVPLASGSAGITVDFADERYVNASGDLMGTGDAWNIYTTNPSLGGDKLDVRLGSTTTPDSGLKAAAKVSRTMNVTGTQLATRTAGDGSDELAALVGSAYGTAVMEGQAVGTAGFAQNRGTNKLAHIGPDACGLYGVGRIRDSGVGLGLGLFAMGRAEGTTASRASGAEITCMNGTGVDSSLTPTGATQHKGIWLHAGGSDSYRSGVGIQLGNPFGAQFEYGIQFSGQVATNSRSEQKQGVTEKADIRTDSYALKGILIKGTHSEAAMAVSRGSGKVLIGAETGAFSSALLEVLHNATADPLVVLGNESADKAVVQVRNSAGVMRLGATGVANDTITGAAAGDAAIWMATSTKKLHLGGSSSVIAIGQNNTLGFNNVTPIAKPSLTYSRTGEHASTAAIRTVLANLGLVTDSTTA